MTVRPTNDHEDHTVVEFGVVSLVEILEDADVSYPTDPESLRDELDDPPIPIDAAGNTVALSEALAESSKTEFGSEQELLDELHPILEAFRTRSGSGLISRIRSLIPF